MERAVLLWQETSMKTRIEALAAFAVAALLAFSAAATERWNTLPPLPPMPAPAQSGFAPVNGIKMYYAVFGEGDPILLIHGGLANSDYWANEVDALSKTHKVIVADSRGHGRSSRTTAPMGYDLMAEDYLALLDYLKVEKTAIVGWSDGAIIGLDIAMHHPERVTKLFANAANVTPDGVKPGMAKSPAFAAFIRRSAEEHRRLAPSPREIKAFLASIRRMWATQPNWTKAQLEKIRVPTAIVLGDHDEAITRAHTEYMARTIPGAKLIILKDVGHFALLQDPDAYTKAIVDFLRDP
jgi:pimeloyl-ACP methyl ester carboxylesterase